jgi:hypothetical protein
MSAGAGGDGCDVVPCAAVALAAAEVYVSEKPERSTLMSVLRMKRSAEELMTIGRGSDAPLSSARSRGVAVCSIGSDGEGLQRQTLAQYVHTHLQGEGGRGGAGEHLHVEHAQKVVPGLEVEGRERHDDPLRIRWTARESTHGVRAH